MSMILRIWEIIYLIFLSPEQLVRCQDSENLGDVCLDRAPKFLKSLRILLWVVLKLTLKNFGWVNFKSDFWAEMTIIGADVGSRVTGSVESSTRHLPEKVTRARRRKPRLQKICSFGCSSAWDGKTYLKNFATAAVWPDEMRQNATDFFLQQIAPNEAQGRTNSTTELLYCKYEH